MTILAVETSCDDTCVAVIDDLKVLSNVISSQTKLHAQYGGIYPMLAKREHIKNLPIVFKKALRLASLAQGEPIDLIAVTIGPGLEPCLWQGINFAKELAKKWKLPVMPVNHIEAHIIANFVGKNTKYLFPAVCLVVSGGHTQLILMKKIGQYEILGETRDDAAGECLDKAARILGLPYPGGPAIAAAAKTYRDPFSVCLPRPMMYAKNYDFSFSGLKTAVLYNFKNQKPIIKKSKKYIQAICAEIQQAIIDVLIRKTMKAALDFGAKTIILGGGVTSNDELRQQFKRACAGSGLAQLMPPKNLCTDNAAMVAATAYFHRLKTKTRLEKIEANANLRI